jgi:hypothetical protein
MEQTRVGLKDHGMISSGLKRMKKTLQSGNVFPDIAKMVKP